MSWNTHGLCILSWAVHHFSCLCLSSYYCFFVSETQSDPQFAMAFHSFGNVFQDSIASYSMTFTQPPYPIMFPILMWLLVGEWMEKASSVPWPTVVPWDPLIHKRCLFLIYLDTSFSFYSMNRLCKGPI